VTRNEMAGAREFMSGAAIPLKSLPCFKRRDASGDDVASWRDSRSNILRVSKRDRRHSSL